MQKNKVFKGSTGCLVSDDDDDDDDDVDDINNNHVDDNNTDIDASTTTATAALLQKLNKKLFLIFCFSAEKRRDATRLSLSSFSPQKSFVQKSCLLSLENKFVANKGRQAGARAEPIAGASGFTGLGAWKEKAVSLIPHFSGMVSNRETRHLKLEGLRFEFSSRIQK